MSNFNITYVPQPNLYSCEEACLAMVARIPIGEAMSVLAKLKVNKGPGFSYFYRALKKYKIGYMSWRSVDCVEDLPPLCLVGVRFPAYGHSVIYYDGIFYDPEFGVMEQYTPGGTIESYVELFIDEVYKNRQTDVRIPADFMEAFEEDPVAYELFNKLPYPQKSKCINGISHYNNPNLRRNNINKIIANLKKTSN